MSDYPYPADEFDEAPTGSQSAGIHRAPRSRWSRVWPFLAVLLIFAALATGLYVWFTNQSPSTPKASATTSVTQAPTTTAPEEPTQSEEPSQSEEPTQTEEPTKTEEPTQTDDESQEPTQDETSTIDRSITVRVLNATRTQGLAAGAVSDVKALGFTDVSGDNYRGTAVTSSQVWYQSAQHAAAAQEIADKLGIRTVQEVDSLVGPVSVILASDFAS